VIGGHHVADIERPDVRAVLREDTDDDVAIGEHADEHARPAALVHDDQRPDVLVAHPLDGLDEGFVPSRNSYVTREHLEDSHLHLRAARLSPPRS